MIVEYGSAEVFSGKRGGGGQEDIIKHNDDIIKHNIGHNKT